MTLGLFDIVQLFSSAIGVLIAVLLVVIPQAKKRNYYFSTFLLLLSYHVFTVVAIEKEWIGQALYFTPAFIFLYGPLLYLYCRQQKHFRITTYDLLHSLIFLLALVLYALLIYDPRVFSRIFFVHFSIYMVLTLVLQPKAKPPLSRWIIFLVVMMVMIWTIALIEGVLIYYYNISMTFPLSFVVYALFLVGVLYFSMAHPALFMDAKVLRSNQRKSPTNESGDQHILEELTKVLNEEKLYQNPELDRELLAQRVNTSPQDLSRIINQHFKTSTPELITTWRIDDAKEMLLSSDLSIKEIYFKVGFSSRSSFNASFKKLTGLTPKDFRSASNMS